MIVLGRRLPNLPGGSGSVESEGVWPNDDGLQLLREGRRPHVHGAGGGKPRLRVELEPTRSRAR